MCRKTEVTSVLLLANIQWRMEATGDLEGWFPNVQDSAISNVNLLFRIILVMGISKSNLVDTASLPS